MIIMVQQFCNRKRELAFLEGKYRTSGSQLIVLYGRRRIGKTELIREFLQDKKGAYIYCTRESFSENMKTFASQFQELTGKRYFEDIRSLNHLFETLVDVVGEERVVVAVDEFPYLVSAEASVPSQLQKIFDEILLNSNIYLILCGSSMEMMERHVLDYRSPLYGRKTGEWKLEPFTIRDISEVSDLSIKDIFHRWSRFGGTPAYILQSLTNFEQASDLILTKGEPLYNEPISLLREELRESRVYTQLLRYISSGVGRQGKLQDLTGLDKGNISRYLEILGSLGYLERIMPEGRKKGGQYRIRDPFVNFWFRYVYPNLSYLEIGKIEHVKKIIAEDEGSYLGEMFERFIESLVTEGILDLGVGGVSRWWHKEREIDLVGSGNDHAIFIEVKWSDLGKKEARRILDDLRQKIDHTGLKKEKNYLGLICRNVKTAGKPDLRDDEFLLTLNDIDEALRGSESLAVLKSEVK